MCNPITSVSGNVQSLSKWKGEKPWEHRLYLRKAVHGEILSQVRSCPHPMAHVRVPAHARSISCQQEFLPARSSAATACLPSLPRFWASPLTEIGFTVEVTWTCSWSHVRNHSVLLAGISEQGVKRSKPKVREQQTCRIPCCTWGWRNQHIANQLLIP